MSAASPLPNLLVCGTPGVGKTTLCSAASERFGLRHVSVGDVVRSRGYHAGTDARFDALVLDAASEDQLLDELEPLMAAGGVLLEFHSVDFFPERWFQRVLVLRAGTAALYDRLTARGYATRKVEENVTAEIMCVVAEEARESYAAGVVHELQHETLEDMEAALAVIGQWLEGEAAAAARAAAAGAGGGAPV